MRNFKLSLVLVIINFYRICFIKTYHFFGTVYYITPFNIFSASIITLLFSFPFVFLLFPSLSVGCLFSVCPSSRFTIPFHSINVSFQFLSSAFFLLIHFFILGALWGVRRTLSWNSFIISWFSSVTQLCPTLCDPIFHSRPGLPAITNSGVYSNSCPLSPWCHPTILSSVVPFSSCLQSFPESGSFQMSQLFASGGQSIGVSVSTSVLPMNIQDWFPLGWTGWISLQPQGLSRVFSKTTVQKHQFFGTQLSLQSNSQIHTWLMEKIIALTIQTFLSK